MCIRDRSRGFLRERAAPQRKKDQQTSNVDEQLRSGASTDRDLLVILATDANAVRRWVALFDFNRFARLEIVLFDEPQEHPVLIDDAAHNHRRSQRAREETLRVLLLDVSLGIRNRIAMRISFRAAEHLVDPLDEPIAYDMLELLGFVVDFVPGVPHETNEEELDQPMTSQNEGGKPLARRREPVSYTHL